ncbi:N-acetylglucosamine-6-phosphate deacetylase [Thomasclavelia spiroformis]|uniref:N-acetylglucosamine-6-phosphate deacetylase n=1 Tax=Thomasclavelia spiroformis TaxID=29348 RepID=UPI0039A1D875
MIIQSKKIWLADQFVAGQIEIVDGKIVGIYDYDEKEVDKDYGDNRVLPGFIDIHCHGAYGFDTNDAKEDGLRYWLRNIVNEGVTALLPTTITQSEEVLTNAVANVAKVVEEGYEGAEVLGIHFEGPYLDMVYKGAQPEQHIVKPTIEQFKKYQKAANGLIKYITMATETDEDFALTRYCAENGVVVSIGHSAATYEQAVRAYAYGARSMTHVYNGMTAFNHRANGLVGGAYRIRNMYGEIICDGNHSTLAALNNYFTSKGPNYSIMVSDALMAKGSPIGSKFIFGGNEIEIYPDGSAHLTSTGGLAGSTLKLNQGLKILIEEALVPVNTAINSCTINPARCLKVDDHKGAIGVGYDGDLVVLDKDYEVIQTYCKGKEMIDGTK